MSKNTGKILAGLAAVGAAVAGAYYYFKKKTEDDFEDEFNEDFDAEEFVLDDDLREVGERGYVSLTPGKEAAPAETQTEAEQSETSAAENAETCSSEECSCCSGEAASSEEGCCCSVSASTDEAEEKSEE